MAEFKHLQLPKARIKMEGRKPPGVPTRPVRKPKEHSDRLKKDADSIITAAKLEPPVTGFDPALVLVAHMDGDVAEDEWNRAGFTVVGSDANKALVLFTSDTEMVEFKRRLACYRQSPPDGQKAQVYDNLFAFIDKLASYQPVDRIGPRLISAGHKTPGSFIDDDDYALDVELWDTTADGERWVVQDRFAKLVAEFGGDATDRYTGDSGWMLARIHCNGAVAKKLLSLTAVRSVDLIPQPDLPQNDGASFTIHDFDEPPDLPAQAPRIGLIDSGMSAHPLLESAVVSSFGVPAKLGDADDWGHGTKVGAICVYGDVNAATADGEFNPPFWLCSAKVVDEWGQFPEGVLVQAQMRKAIEELFGLGCRIINISLGDRTAVYDGGRVSPWAATLDDLAREFDLLIVVSAGNVDGDVFGDIDDAVKDYPSYLCSDRFRIVEPATASNVLTVGSIAHGNGLPRIAEDCVGIQPICDDQEPSPYSRSGPGVDGAAKPELVDFGGTLVFDGTMRCIKTGQQWPSAGIVTFNADYRTDLFTSASGTSYAAPLVTYKAALLKRRFRDASPNLLRALLVTAADVPSPASAKLADIGKEASRRVCGYGMSRVENALASEDNRVILHAEDDLTVDEFVVYEIDMLDEFRSVRGKRRIRVTLAYDPPTRRTRADYLGVEMDFRLIRNAELSAVVEFFRKRNKKVEGRHIDFLDRQKDNLKPGPKIRDHGTLQSATYVTSRKIGGDADMYYVVVRCKRKWATIESQRYAIAVELKHEQDIGLRAKLRLRQRIRLRA